MKGISIFLALADATPHMQFAAVPTWGTNASDFADLRARANVTILNPVDDIADLMRKTRVLLVPVWHSLDERGRELWSRRWRAACL